MSLFKSLYNPPFRLIWSGQSLSRLGDSVYRVALAWWILKQTGSATMMGSMLLFSFVPMLLMLPIAGVVVDRFSRTRLMLISDFARAIIVGLMSLLLFLQLLEVWHVYVANVIFGIADAFFQPAFKALLPELTPKEYLRSANSLTNLSRQGSDTAGPIICAVLVAYGGVSLAFLVDAASFLISALLVLRVANQSSPTSRTSVNTGGLGEGIAIVIRTPWLWVTILIAAFSNITLHAPLQVALPFLISGSLRQGIGSLAFVYSMLALGSIVSTVWLGHTAKIQSRGLIAYGAWATSGLLLVSFGLPLPLSVLGLIAAVIGGLLSLFGLLWLNTMQELVSNEFLGRLSSIDSVGSFLLLPIGYLVIGRLTDSFGARSVFLVCGLITCLLVLLGLAHPAIRKLE